MTALAHAHAWAWGWSLDDVLTAIIAIAACIGILYVILSVCEVKIPAWVIKIFVIVAAAALGILAIRFLLSL